jgi:hypothetical protein
MWYVLYICILAAVNARNYQTCVYVFSHALKNSIRKNRVQGYLHAVCVLRVGYITEDIPFLKNRIV